MSKVDELVLRVTEKLERECTEAPEMEEVVPYLLERAGENGENGLAMLDESKTLAGAYAAIEEASRKKWEQNRQQKGQCIGTKEACRILDTYYGLKAPQSATPARQTGKVVSLFDML